MTNLLIAAAIASGLSAIAADRRVRQPWFYLAKPLTTLLIMLLAYIQLAPWPDYRSWVLAAYLGCLLGDIALMFPGSRAFMLGLTSFLIGHLLLIAAFAAETTLTTVPSVAMLIAAAVFVALVLAYLRWLLPRTGKLAPAVVLYVLALMAMVLTTLWRAAGAADDSAWIVCAGALLFALSDATLAYCKFVRAPSWGQAAILSSYYSAIGLIAWAH